MLEQSRLPYRERSVSPPEAQDDTIPTVALLLGVAGLLPFLGSAVMTWVSSPTGSEIAVFSIRTYAAVILSFLGGVRWGVCLRDPEALSRVGPLTLSIMPSIVAWVAVLMAPRLGLLTLIVGLAAQYLLDRFATRRSQLPDWYGRLRTLLSIGAIASLILALVGATMRGVAGV